MSQVAVGRPAPSGDNGESRARAYLGRVGVVLCLLPRRRRWRRRGGGAAAGPGEGSAEVRADLRDGERAPHAAARAHVFAVTPAPLDVVARPRRRNSATPSSSTRAATTAPMSVVSMLYGGRGTEAVSPDPSRE
jgi:hypothetical protein